MAVAMVSGEPYSAGSSWRETICGMLLCWMITTARNDGVRIIFAPENYRNVLIVVVVRRVGFVL